MNNHEADIKNANKGTDGVNSTYAKAQGNKGKLLNPNQKSSLIVVFEKELQICAGHYKKENGDIELIWKDFIADYLDKGFAEDIGARRISSEELKHRAILDPCAGQCPPDDEHRFLYFGNFYTCIEFLKDKETPWTLKDAEQFVIDRINPKVGEKYREFFYIDGICTDNHISRRWDREFENEPLEYCPAIDGY